MSGRMHKDEELDKIREMLFRMGLLVEEAIRNSADSLFEKDSRKAARVVESDQEINRFEVGIDDLGHEYIARFQPAAADLRFITMVLKITADLERMGDQAVNIAQAAEVMNQEPPVKPFEHLPAMVETACRMVHDALASFMEGDLQLANAILETDDAIDECHHRIYDEMQEIIGTRPELVRPGISLIMISHNLERVGDLATNIAEDVIYLRRGVDVRHQFRENEEGIS